MRTFPDRSNCSVYKINCNKNSKNNLIVKFTTTNFFAHGIVDVVWILLEVLIGAYHYSRAVLVVAEAPHWADTEKTQGSCAAQK